MLWCCASFQRRCSEHDDHQVEEQKHEVVVEKLAIKSIPLLPRQRLSSSPEYSNLRCHIPRHSSTASQSTQTSLSMQHLQFLSIPDYETSPLSSFTKVERVQEANNADTAYNPCRQGIQLMDCTVLFTSVSPQEEVQYQPLYRDPTPEGISNPNLHKKILTSPNSETLIYKSITDTSSESICNDSEPIPDKPLQIEKANSDFIHKEPKFVNEDASVTKITSTKNIGPSSENANSDFFPSSERLICVQELENQTSIAEDQNLTANMKEVYAEVPSEFCNKNKLLSIHLVSDEKHTSHCSLSIHKSQNECSNSTHEVSVSEKPATFSNSASLKAQNFNDIQVPFSPSRRKISSSASNVDVPESFDKPAAVKPECQPRETKSCVITLLAPSLISETPQTVPEETFQQSIAKDIELNEDKSLQLDLTHSTEELKAETEKNIMPNSEKNITTTENKINEIHSDKNAKSTEELKADIQKENKKTTMPEVVKDTVPIESKKNEELSNKITKSTEELKVNKDNEETIMPLTIKDVTSTESFKSERHSDKNTESIVTCLLSVNDQHSTCLNNSGATSKPLPLQKLEPMPTFIGFTTAESTLEKKAFTPEHLSIFLATCIKNYWLTPAAKFICSTSHKTAKLSMFSEKSTSLQTKQIVPKQHTIENDSNVLRQAQKNMSNLSTRYNCKKKFENHLQYSSNNGNYSGSSSKVETYKVKRKYQETTLVVKNTFGDSCPKEVIMIADETNTETHLKENKCSQTSTSSGQKTDSQSTHEDEKFTQSTSTSSFDMLCDSSVTNPLQKPGCPSKCAAQKLNLSKEALQSWSKHQKCASSRKGSENMLDHHSLLKTSSESSTSAQNFTFEEGRFTAPDAEILPNEYNPMYLGIPETIKQNILETANNYEFPIQQYLHNNSKEICKTNQNVIDVSPYSSNTLTHNKLATKCDNIPMKEQHNNPCISPIQAESSEEIKIVNKITRYKEIKKFSYNDNDEKQSGDNTVPSCIPKSETHITDALPLSASSSYEDDHSFHGRSYIPTSNSQSSLLTIEETEEPTMCWTIIIKHVNPDKLHE